MANIASSTVPTERALLVRLIVSIVLPNAAAAFALRYLFDAATPTTALAAMTASAFVSVVLAWQVAGPLRTIAISEMKRSADVISHALEAIITTDADGSIRSLNPGGERMFGWSAAEVIGKPIETIVQDSSFTSYRRALAQNASEGTAPGANVVFQATTKSGAILAVEGSFSAYGGAGAIVMNGILRDVTARVRAEQALRESESSFRSLIELSPDAILVVRDDLIAYANAAAVELLGYVDRKDLIKRPYATVATADDDEASVNLWTKQERSIRGLQQKFVRKDGTLVSTEVSSLAMIFAGEPAMVAIARDVTARDQMRGQLMLADRMASLGSLAAGVGHEINNPLMYVQLNLGFIEEVLARASETHGDAAALAKALADVKQSTAEALEGTSRIARIVADLSATARSDEKSRPVDVREALEASIRMSAQRFVARARVVTSFQAVPHVECPPGRLGQVFLNLLINAAQAIPEGRVDEHVVRVSTRADNLRVIVEISDTGCGIPKELHARIFDPFFTTKPIGEGSGLGLAVCRGIVARIGGEIRVESTVGKGSTFTVELPGTIDPPKAEPVAVRAAPPRLSVMIVDDEAALARGLERALKSEHSVVAVTSGREALDMLRRGAKVDVIICDLMMPDVTGMELYDQVGRARPELLPRFLFMTGGAFTKTATDFLARVPNTCMQKPIDVRELRKRIAAFARG